MTRFLVVLIGASLLPFGAIGQDDAGGARVRLVACIGVYSVIAMLGEKSGRQEISDAANKNGLHLTSVATGMGISKDYLAGGASVIQLLMASNKIDPNEAADLVKACDDM
jgi:hypothetical protein